MKSLQTETATVNKLSRKKFMVITFLVIPIAVASITAYYLLSKKDSDAFEYENSSIVGLMPGVDRDALLAQMQESVDKSAIAFSISSSPIIEDTKIEIFFENPKGNAKDVVLELFDNATGDSIYKSKAIKEGSYLQYISLNKAYEAGEYIFTAYITAYDEQTHAIIGQVAAELKAISL